ncbi:MAG TPA: carboxypeptidase-like regulatory domain-containing protein, partial [Blastocatellia bacterium]|nr:carboxypeptidase-like regulatory domain-containing protein [Blastocatellia bacterium]
MKRGYFQGLSLAFALVLAVFAAPQARAQGTSDGSLAGVVNDASGAVIAGARVSVRNNSTGQTLNSTSNDEGSFRFNNLPVGTYTVTIEAPNFKRFVNNGVAVNLNRVTDLTIPLEPGQITEQVTVTGGSSELIERSTSQLGKSFEGKTIVDLPAAFSDANQLALLSPNVVSQSSGVTGFGGSVGGNRPRNNGFTLDGVDNNDPTLTGPQIFPIADSIAEFTVLTNQFSAEFGHSSAGQFSSVTKTGSNDFHGGAWYYVQNRNFNAFDVREKDAIASGSAPDQHPRFDFNRVGGDFGGRIIRDKLFFFGAYQYQTQGLAGATNAVLTPTAAGFNLLSTTPGVSPFTLNILRAHLPASSTPVTTTTVLGTEVPLGQVNLLVADFFATHQFNINIDQIQGTKDSLRYRFIYDRTRQPTVGDSGPEFTGTTRTDNRMFSFTEIHNISPNKINEFRFGYRRQNFLIGVPETPFADFPSDIFPNIEIDEIGVNIGPFGCAPQGQVTNLYQWADTFSWTKGRHQMKYGVDVRNTIAPASFLPRLRGEYDFSTLSEFLRDVKPTGANGGLRGIGSGTFAINFPSIYWFVQDDIKIRPDLTLNVGLRYEWVGNSRDTQLQNLNRIADVEANDPGLIAARNLLGRPDFFPEGIHFREPKTDKNNFAPRIGFAWSPSFEGGILGAIFGKQGDSSIRAGYTLAHDFFFQNLATLQLPPQFQSEIDASSGNGGLFGSNTNFLANGGIPGGGGTLDPALFTDTALARSLTQAFVPDMITPYTQSWSLSYQRQFLNNWAVEFRYLGTHASHLFSQIRLNAGVDVTHRLGVFLPTFFSRNEVPGLNARSNLTTLADATALSQRALSGLGFSGNVTSFEQQGSSVYHGFSANLKRRFATGLTLDTSYTWSHVIDDGTNELFTSFINPRRPEDPLTGFGRERSTSALDRTHRFVIGWVWDLPFGSGRALLNNNKFISSALGGWTISGIYQIESGQPVTPISGIDANLNSDSAGDRSIINPNGQEGVGSTVSAVLNTNFSSATSGCSGNIVGFGCLEQNGGDVPDSA